MGTAEILAGWAHEHTPDAADLRLAQRSLLSRVERGYRFTAVVDHHAAKDKLRALAAMGTHLVYVSGDTSGGPQSVRRRQVARE